MGTWYDKFPEYYERLKKTCTEIEEGKYNLNLSATYPKKYIRHSEEENKYFYSGPEKLKHLLSKFQYFAHLNTSSTDIKRSENIEFNIFSQPITFRLSESQIPSKYIETKMVRGKQILFTVVDENGKRKMTAYADIMPQLEKYHSKDLAKAMLNALNTSQFYQNSEGLKERIIPAASLFILLTHIPEAAIPFTGTMEEFDSAIRFNKNSVNPKDKIVNIKKKTGRIPMADKIVRSKLRDVAEGKVLFKDAFSEKNFVIRGKDGTSKGRTWVLEDQAGVLTGDLSDSEDESGTISGLQIERKCQDYLHKVLIPES